MVVCEATLDHEIIFAETSTKCLQEPSSIYVSKEGCRANGYARSALLRVKANPFVAAGLGITNRELNRVTTLTIVDDRDMPYWNLRETSIHD